ncbi:MAG: hypothetical protein KIG88_11650 [Weeksellaceae bacterium]|nr:hypothetical protein [Weeksellaceae bacterium]
MNLFRIEITNGFQTFAYYFISKDGYIGDDQMRKKIISHVLGVHLDKELWEEYKRNNPDYMIEFEIIEVEKIKEVIYE